jgi:hypothetical protein
MGEPKLRKFNSAPSTEKKKRKKERKKVKVFSSPSSGKLENLRKNRALSQGGIVSGQSSGEPALLSFPSASSWPPS